MALVVTYSDFFCRLSFQNQPINPDKNFSRAFTEHRFPPLIIVIVSDCFMGSGDKFSARRCARQEKALDVIEQATRVPPLPGVLHNADAGLFWDPLMFCSTLHGNHNQGRASAAMLIAR